MMCAARAGQRGRRVLLIEHYDVVGEKIRISGGGRCNFTNLNAAPECYLSQNPDFCRSALARYTPMHFVEMVERHGIAYHEKKLGQLFCDRSARDIISMLQGECADAKLREHEHPYQRPMGRLQARLRVAGRKKRLRNDALRNVAGRRQGDSRFR